MAQQLTFDLPSQPALGRGDYFVSPSNATAVDLIQTWHDWPQGKLLLVGPMGSGKTHLAHVWATLTGAQIVAADTLVNCDTPQLAQTAIVVEDADQIAGQMAEETHLFHLHNLALANGTPMLLTARQPAIRWGLALADLQSRMQGSAMATLRAPDDALLGAILVKLFADRQLTVDPGVIGFVLDRMDRSFADAGRIVEALDHAALAKQRRITKPLAGEVLDKLGCGGAY